MLKKMNVVVGGGMRLVLSMASVSTVAGSFRGTLAVIRDFLTEIGKHPKAELELWNVF
jgi:hypothetical protein